MIIVTGGAGFIGSCFLKELNTQGIDKILVVDDLGSGEKWKNLRGKQISDYQHKGAFLASLEAHGLPEGTTAVVHLGACSTTTETDAEYMLQNNYRYSKAVAEACLRAQVRLVYASSAATYGDGALGFSDREELLDSYQPLNVYAYSKQLFDSWAYRSGALAHICGVKFFNVFGPNEYHKGDMRSVVLKAYEQVQADGKISLFKSYRSEYADGEQMRDFVYVEDCTKVLWWLLNNQVAGVLNLGTGAAASWNQLARGVFTALGKKPNIEYVEMPEYLQPKYQYFTQAEMQKLQTLGYTTPFTSIESATHRYVTEFLGHSDRKYL